MPDIDEGLTINGEPAVTYEEGDVNAPGGFEAALAGKVQTEPEPEPEPDEPEPEDDEQPRDPVTGQFVAREPEVPPEETADYWRARYEAERATVDRQGNELGELRQWAQQQQAPPPQQTSGPLDIESLIEERGGDKMIEWAIDNAPEYIDEIYERWALSGDPQGMVEFTKYQRAHAELAQQPRQDEPAPDETLQALSTERKLTEVWREARQDPQFASYEAGIGLALSSSDTPDEIKLMLVSGNIDHMREAVKFLKPYAQLEAIRAGAQPQPQNSPEPPAEDSPAEQARREQIRRTAIVTGSQRLQSAGVAPEANGELSREERINRFKDMFEEEPSTSISAGLTINGQPVLPPRPRRSQ